MIHQLEQRLSQPLPGKQAQLLMAPPMRIQGLLNENYPGENHSAKLAAVLILLYPKNGEYYLTFIKRTTYDGEHSGQIAFPGGRYEITDPDLVFTALREAEEEVGVSISQVHVLGKLTELYIPPSNFLILPVVGYTEQPLHFVAQEDEVAGILEIPLNDFFNPQNLSTLTVTPHKTPSFETPCFKIQNEIIWGATAMVMSELITVIKEIGLR